MKIIPSSRKHCYAARIGVLLVTAVLIAGVGGAYYVGSDNNTPAQNLEIRTWYDLDAIRDNLSGNHTLMNDLDSNTLGYEELASPTANQGKGWEPIGFFGTLPLPDVGCSGAVPPPAVWRFGLTGTFDGQEYEIRDLYIDRPDDCYECPIGLFTCINEGGIIKNVGVVNITMTGCYAVGGLVGDTVGNLTNCYATGSVTGNSGVGGLIGTNGGDVSNCHFTGSVTGNYSVGGLVGSNSGTISNSYSTGSVTGNEYIGGLVGRNWRDVSNSYYNYDEVLINGENVITIGALFDEDFDQWLANDKFLDVSERLSQEDGYYVINNVADLKELLAFGQDSSLKFRLKNDLDLTTESNFYIPYLAGKFDGNGHKITNLSLNFDFVSYVGLFGCLGPGGKVTQVGVENVNITGDDLVGGLVGENDGTVSYSYSTGSVTGDMNVGGLVGSNSGTISNSYSTGSVTGNEYIGGLVGQNWRDVSNSYSTSSVTGDDMVGGLVGDNVHGNVTNSYSAGDVTGDVNVGGLVGKNDNGTVSDSYCISDVSGHSSVGGLVGYNAFTSTVTNSYSAGAVTGGSEVGGLVGVNRFDGVTSNSFWDIETSGRTYSDGGTGKTTAEMQNIATFSGAGWSIIAVADSGIRNLSCIWNIVDDDTYPFLNWQP
jgi:hypothetical protein